jgi:hypothetical protein
MILQFLESWLRAHMNPFLSAAIAIISAGVASVLTYFLTIRAKRIDVLNAEQLAAFRSVQSLLNSFRQYYLAELADLQGNEFAPRLVDLPKSEREPPIQQRHALDRVLANNYYFLGPNSRNCLESLDGPLNLLCHAELLRASEPDNREYDNSLKKAYEDILDKIDLCSEHLFAELGLPSIKPRGRIVSR